MTMAKGVQAAGSTSSLSTAAPSSPPRPSASGELIEEVDVVGQRRLPILRCSSKTTCLFSITKGDQRGPVTPMKWPTPKRNEERMQTKQAARDAHRHAG
jgi:hypothetical protein